MTIAASAGMGLLFDFVFHAQSFELSPSFWVGPVGFLWVLFALAILGYRGSRELNRGRKARYWMRMAQILAVYGVLGLVVGFLEALAVESIDIARNMGYMPFTALFLGVLFLSFALLMMRPGTMARGLNGRSRV